MFHNDNPAVDEFGQYPRCRLGVDLVRRMSLRIWSRFLPSAPSAAGFQPKSRWTETERQPLLQRECIGTSNREPQEYGRNIIGIYLPGS